MDRRKNYCAWGFIVWLLRVRDVNHTAGLPALFMRLVRVYGKYSDL